MLTEQSSSFSIVQPLSRSSREDKKKKKHSFLTINCKRRLSCLFLSCLFFSFRMFSRFLPLCRVFLFLIFLSLRRCRSVCHIRIQTAQLLRNYYRSGRLWFDSEQGCELDRFLTEFKFEFMRYLQVRVQVRVLRILFFEFTFEFSKNDRVQRVRV